MSHTATPRVLSGSSAQQLLEECTAMLRHALASGTPVPSGVARAVHQCEAGAAGPDELAALLAAHGRLAKLVAPATPRGLRILGAEEGSASGLARFFGPVPLVRHMMLAGLVSLALFIALSLTAAISRDTEEAGVLDLFGRVLFANELFWLSAAGIGAAFAVLFRVNAFIATCSYDPRYVPTYWLRFFLGVVAGFILVALVPLGGGEGAGAHLAKPTLALLGGFSAGAVHRILERLVNAIESIFSGSPDDLLAARADAAAERAGSDVARTRIEVASRLVALRDELAAGRSTDEASAAVGTLIRALLPDDGQMPEPPGEAPADDGRRTSPAADVTQRAAVAVPAIIGAGPDVPEEEAKG